MRAPQPSARAAVGPATMRDAWGPPASLAALETLDKWAKEAVVVVNSLVDMEKTFVTADFFRLIQGRRVQAAARQGAHQSVSRLAWASILATSADRHAGERQGSSHGLSIALHALAATPFQANQRRHECRGLSQASTVASRRRLAGRRAGGAAP